MIVLYDPYADILKAVQENKIGLSEFMRVITERNAASVADFHRRLLQEIEDEQKKRQATQVSGKRLLFGVSV